MNLVFKMIAGTCVIAVSVLTVQVATAAAFPQFMIPTVAVSPANHIGHGPYAVKRRVVDMSEDRLARRCRNKIRRELGAPRKSGGIYRIAFVQRCIASGGKSW